jgi:hypothetical protein
MRLTDERNKVVRLGPITVWIIGVVLLSALVLYKAASDNVFIKVGEVAETDPKVTYKVIDLLRANSIKVDYGCTVLCSVRVRKKDASHAVQLLTTDSKLNNYTFTEL